MLESDIQAAIRLHVSKQQLATLFRANVGEAWTGKVIEKQPNGDILIKNPRRLKTGLPNGFPDTFGFRSVTVTPEMVDNKLAIFVGLEIKQPKKKPTLEQSHMLKFLNDAGAIAGVATSPEEAEMILNGKGT